MTPDIDWGHGLARDEIEANQLALDRAIEREQDRVIREMREAGMPEKVKVIVP